MSISELISLQKDGRSLVSEKEAQNLFNLTFENGEVMLDDTEFLYEISWLLNETDYDIVYNFLNAGWEKVLGSENIRQKILFQNPLMEPARNKFTSDMNIYKTRVEVEAGEKCRKCGSMETISLSKQSRSCDEMTSIKIICINCKFRWSAQ
tara:strand:- start:76 stop:528 length:453 start_codon:yes stop_codon:yes gene_type:complete